MINLELILQVTLNLYLCPFNNQKVNNDSKEFINLHQNNCWNLRFRAAIQGGWQISSRTYWKKLFGYFNKFITNFLPPTCQWQYFSPLRVKGPKSLLKTFYKCWQTYNNRTSKLQSFVLTTPSPCRGLEFQMKFSRLNNANSAS